MFPLPFFSLISITFLFPPITSFSHTLSLFALLSLPISFLSLCLHISIFPICITDFSYIPSLPSLLLIPFVLSYSPHSHISVISAISLSSIFNTSTPGFQAPPPPPPVLCLQHQLQPQPQPQTQNRLPTAG